MAKKLNNYIAINATSLFKSPRTGIEWYTYRLLEYLEKVWDESDPQVVLLAPRNLFRNSDRKLFALRANWKLKLIKGKYLWTQFYLLRFLKKYPPSLLFNPSYVAPLFLPKNIPTVAVVHGLEGEYYPEFKSLKQTILEYLWIIPSLKKSAQLIAVSRHTKKDINYFYGISTDKIKTVMSGPGSLNEDLFETRLFSDNRKSLASNEDIKFLFFGGDERKNLKLAIRIFFKFKKSITANRNAFLYITGKVKDKKLKKIISRRKKDIIELGYLSEGKKRKHLKLANFLLYPSFYEGFGFPILEAQAFGAIPIILKDNGLNEVGGGGLIEYDVNEEKKSMSKIIDCITKPDKYKKLQKLGRENVKKYSWEKCAAATKKTIIKIINKQ